MVNLASVMHRSLRQASLLRVVIVKNVQTRRVWTQEQKTEIVHKHLNDHIAVRTLERSMVQIAA